MMKRNAVLFAAKLLSIVVLNPIYFAACGRDDPPPPEVVGCNTVLFQGETYEFPTGLFTGCFSGKASFTTTITQNGKTVCFNITCTGVLAGKTRVSRFSAAIAFHSRLTAKL